MLQVDLSMTSILAGELDLAAPRLFSGPTPAGHEVLPATRFLDPAFVSRALTEAACHFGTDDLRTVASLWNKQYNAALLMAPLAAMTLAGIGLDLSIERTGIVLRNGLPYGVLVDDSHITLVCPDRVPAGVASGGLATANAEELQHAVLHSLFPRHLAQVNETVHQVARVSRLILWGNAGNLVGWLYDELAPARPGARAAIASDREILLERSQSPVAPERNPLYRTIRYESVSAPDLPPTMRVRNTCCLRYKVSGGKACYTCPLVTAEERIALLREAGH